jgi:hypothetical protein
MQSLLKALRLNFIFYFWLNKNNLVYSRRVLVVFSYGSLFKFRHLARMILSAYRTVVKDGFLYLRTLVIIFFVDATFTDDEPLWEPIEWSLVMTWILFIFIFAWIAENLITSRYGSYTGRDKRVWLGWFKTFW